MDNTRQKALDALLPAWTDQRRRVAEVGSAVKELQADHKKSKEELGRTEANLDHVSECRHQDCLRCQELSLNGAV